MQTSQKLKITTPANENQGEKHGKAGVEKIGYIRYLSCC